MRNGIINREHAIIEKRIINLDHGGSRHVMCGWDDCENDAFELYKCRINYGTAATPHIVNIAFCCEKHKQYYIEASYHDARYGRLPAGCR
jgi:hypothetical protein